MASYVDLYLLPVPKKNLAAYRRIARQFGKIAKDCGVIDYREFMGDDLTPKGVVPFTKHYKLGPGEILIASTVVFKSRAHRDKTLKAMFNDPRMQKMMKMKPIFDMKKMVYGGFKTFVEM